VRAIRQHSNRPHSDPGRGITSHGKRRAKVLCRKATPEESRMTRNVVIRAARLQLLAERLGDNHAYAYPGAMSHELGEFFHSIACMIPAVPFTVRSPRAGSAAL
jgi:hypothetical protein